MSDNSFQIQIIKPPCPFDVFKYYDDGHVVITSTNRNFKYSYLIEGKETYYTQSRFLPIDIGNLTEGTYTLKLRSHDPNTDIIIGTYEIPITMLGDVFMVRWFVMLLFFICILIGVSFMLQK